MTSFLRFFLTWWGALVLGALDSTPFFFVPFGTDALVVYLAARDRSLFWLYPVLTTAGSIAGTVLTYTIGVTIGDTGLVRFVPQQRLERLRKRVKNIGAIALGISAGLPPPFPMTAFVLTCGALKVSRARFLTVVAIARLVRFGVEATLARRYGPSVVRLLETDASRRIILGLVVVSIAGTVLTILRVWRSTRRSSEDRRQS